MESSLLVIVVIFNGIKWLDKCLSSVTASSVKADIFVVDNGSADGSLDFVKTHYPDAIVVESKENLGFGAANNIGLKHALNNNYDYVYLLNQDAWVQPHTFEKLIYVSKAHPEYGILSPLQTNADMTRLERGFAQNCPINLISDSVLGMQLTDVYETKFVMAAHWLIPCTCLKLVGGFSPTFYHYGEDVNCADRVTYHGKKIGIVPGCIGVHDRENRDISKAKEQYLFYCYGLIVMSNPNAKKRFVKLCKDYTRAIVEEKSFAYIKYFFKTIRARKKISQNNKQSTQPQAFLN